MGKAGVLAKSIPTRYGLCPVSYGFFSISEPSMRPSYTLHGAPYAQELVSGHDNVGHDITD